MRAHQTLPSLLAALAGAFPLAACRPPDTKNPETWIARLSENDPKRRVQAVQELRKLRARQAAPQVAELLHDPLVREDAALALGDLGGPEQVPALLDAIDTTVGAGSDQATRTTNRTNLKIADSLGSLGDARAGPALLRLARAKDDLVRLAAVQALGAIKFKESVGEISRIVDDESAPPILVKKAIVALGQIGDPAALPALQHALVLERNGVSFLSESSFAIFLLGQPAVEPMLRLLQDQDPAWLAFAKETNRAPAGTYAKSAIVLGDLGDARAVPVLLQKLKYTDPDPIPQTSKLLSSVVRQFSADALGRLRAKEAAAPILALASTRDAGDEEQDLFLANALVWIGDRSSAKELLKRAQSGAVRPRLVLAQAAALLGDPALKKDLIALVAKEKRGQVKECQKSIAELQNAQPVDDKAACDKLGELFAALATPLEAAESCGEPGSAGVAAAGAGGPRGPASGEGCWSGKLAEKDPLVRARAAYELGRAGAAGQVPALLKVAADGDLSARLAGIRALEWLIGVPAAQPALKAGAPVLAAQLAAEQGRIQFLKVNEELRRLQARLARL